MNDNAPMDPLQKAAEVLNQTSHPLPEGMVTALVNHFTDRREHFISAAPTPFYYLDREALSERAKRFRAAFESHLPDTGFFYAVKSNNHPLVAQTLLREGFGLDVSSGEELSAALDLGARQIVFSGPGKTDGELLQATLNAPTVCVLIDSFGELERLQRIAREQDVVVRAGVRLTTNPNGLWRKFGIPLSDLSRFWDLSRHLTHVHLEGLQFHTSWNLTPDAQVAFLADLGETLATMPDDFKQRIAFVDIGGGYWPEEGDWTQPDATPRGRLLLALGERSDTSTPPAHTPGTPIAAFAETLSRALEAHLFPHLACRVCFEPGRWLANNAMHIVLSVVDKKGEDLVITDAGTNAIGWERFEFDYAPVINLTRPDLTERPCHVLGSLCTPHDVWGYSYFGAAIEPGDRLLIPNQGAYTYSLRQHFIKKVPPVVVG